MYNKVKIENASNSISHACSNKHPTHREKKRKRDKHTPEQREREKERSPT